MSSRLGVDAAGPLPSYRKTKIAKKPIENTLDRCNLLRHKLSKETIRLGTLNIQGIRKKQKKLSSFLEEIKQDITILIETKKKGNGLEILTLPVLL